MRLQDWDFKVLNVFRAGVIKLLWIGISMVCEYGNELLLRQALREG